jgi:hypothetical protein
MHTTASSDTEPHLATMRAVSHGSMPLSSTIGPSGEEHAVNRCEQTRAAGHRVQPRAPCFSVALRRAPQSGR